MWLFYEQPQVDFRDLVQKFMDIRKRAFRFPSLGKKTKYIGIPTTSGTGSEVTPFAVISDKKNNRKYPLADYSLTPTIAIVDPALVESVPDFIAADTGMDVLTHATEAYTSNLLTTTQTVSPFKQSNLSLNGWKDLLRLLIQKLAKKCTMHLQWLVWPLPMPSLGMTHSMAHKIGAVHHTIHGRTNAILLPYVIRYNGTRPSKTTTWPKYNYLKADENSKILLECLDCLTQLRRSS